VAKGKTTGNPRDRKKTRKGCVNERPGGGGLRVLKENHEDHLQEKD